METAMLIWVVVGAGITAGVFLLARAVVEIGGLAYQVIERTMSREAAARRGGALAAGAGVALLATALIAAIAVLAIFAAVLNAQFGGS